VTILASRSGGAIVPLAPIPLPTRVGTALVSCVTYAWKAICPVSLSVFYPYPLGGVPFWKPAGAVALLAAAAVIAARQRRDRPWLAFGLAWFLVSLAPVIGIVQVGIQSMANRYTYLALTGLFVILVWGAAELRERFRMPGWAAGSAAGAILLLLAVAARQEIMYWSSDVALFGRAIEVTGNNWQAHSSLAVHYFKSGMPDEAERHYRETLRIVPDDPEAHSDLATLLLAKGKNDEALAHLVEAVRLRPGLVTALHNLGVVLSGMGRTDEAAEIFREVIRRDPGIPSAHNNLGMILLAQGKPDEALARFEEALRLKPDYPEARANLEAAQRRLQK
jgi:Flp pilus assembly protein TadD